MPASLNNGDVQSDAEEIVHNSDDSESLLKGYNVIEIVSTLVIKCIRGALMGIVDTSIVACLSVKIVTKGVSCAVYYVAPDGIQRTSIKTNYRIVAWVKQLPNSSFDVRLSCVCNFMTCFIRRRIYIYLHIHLLNWG